MDYIGEPGQQTQRYGHMIDLIFSNILYAQTWIRNNIYVASDHETQVIMIPSRGRAKLKQVYYRITKSDLFIFVGFIRNKTIGLPDL
jgi:hypothetical protein